MHEHTHDEQQSIDATSDQIAMLKELGVSDLELEGLSYEDAETMIDTLRTMQRDAGKIKP